jgi:hypothetical protein
MTPLFIWTVSSVACLTTVGAEPPPAPAPPASAPPTPARPATPPADISALEKRLQRLEDQLDAERLRNERNEAVIRSLQTRVVPEAPQARVAADDPAMRERVKSALDQLLADPDIKSKLAPSDITAGYRKDVDYQGGGFYVKDRDGKFLLNIGGSLQTRYNYYNQLERGYRDGRPDFSGANRDIRSDFQIPRMRMIFGGYAFDPAITFILEADASTQKGDAYTIQNAWVNWNATAMLPNVGDFWRDAAQVRVGEFQQPFGRWQTKSAWSNQGERDFQVVDRWISTQYFRADRAVGLDMHGVFGGVREGLDDRPGARGFFEWEVAVTNGWQSAGSRFGLDTDNSTNFSSATARQLDKYPTLIVRGLFDVLKGRYEGEDGKDYYWFGKNQSDLEHHLTPAVEIGGSFGWERFRSQAGLPDNFRTGTFYRPETQRTAASVAQDPNSPGSGAPLPPKEPGSDDYHYGLDAAAKWRGFSLTTEGYYESVKGLNNAGGRFRNQDQDLWGYYAQAGYFIVPKTVELFGGAGSIFPHRRPQVPRNRQVTGQTDGSIPSDAHQFTLGANYFPFHTQNLKLSIDASYLTNPPIGNATPGYVASSREDAWQMRVQLQFGF